MDKPTILAIIDCLTSSESSGDEETIKYMLSKKVSIIRKIKNYIVDVVHVYTDIQVSIIYYYKYYPI